MSIISNMVRLYHLTGKSRLLPVFILVLLPFLVYMNSLSNGFVWDDESIIVDNPRLSGFNKISDLLTSEDAFRGVKTGYYRPFAYLSFFVDRLVWGLNPFGFHLINLLLHISVSISLFFLMRLMFNNDVLAFFSALIFSIHPVNTEAVNFLSGGRNTLLSGLFMLLSFILHLKKRLLPSLLSYGIAVFSKEFAIPFPFLLIFYDNLCAPGKKSLKAYLPYFGVIIIFFMVRTASFKDDSFVDLDLYNIKARMMLMPEIFISYLKMFFLPFRFKIPYYLQYHGRLDIRVMSFSLGLVTIILILLFFRKSRATILSFFWFFLFLLPVSNIIPLDITLAERYMYFPAMGLSLFLAHLFQNLKKIIGSFIIALFCIFCIITISGRNHAWRDNFSLYNQMISDSPEAGMGFYNLGFFYYLRGDTPKARELFEMAVNKFPVRASAYTMLAFTNLELDDPDKALQYAIKSLSLQPELVRNYFILSRAYQKKGDERLSGLYLKRLLEKVRLSNLEGLILKRAEMFCDDAESYQAEDSLQKAEMLFRRALVFQPELARALLGLGSVIAQKGDIDKALGYFKKAVEIEPGNPIPHYDLSLAYRLKGMTKEAELEKSLYLQLGGDPKNLRQ